MDLGELLDVTKPVTFEFMEKTFTAHVFTAGYARLTQEDRERLETVSKPADEAKKQIKEIEAQLESANGNKAELEAEIASLARKANNIALAHETLPVIVEHFDGEDGKELIWHGAPITRENIARVPEDFLWSAFVKSVPVWQDPTRPESGPASQSAAEHAEQNPAETTTPLPTSEQPHDGSTVTP